jgi:hypothetical protein
MTNNRDPQTYRARARRWREEAAAALPGQTRDAYVVLAEGYERLADLIRVDSSGRNADRPAVVAGGDRDRLRP